MLRITVQEYSHLRRFKRSDEIDREGKSNFIATNIYRRLNQVTFDGNDLGNSGGWADIDHINNFMNQAIGNNGNQLAYYISPIGFGFGTEEAIKDSLKHICKRKTTDDSIINDHYGNELDKPFIFIVNTETVLDNDPTGIRKTKGGSHWISWVLLPKEYTSLSGEETKNDKYQVLFFDSYAKKSIPEGLKKGLTNGMTFVEDQTSVKLLPLCKENEIVFHDNNKLTGQQMNSNDCGWWASYYALMTVYTGKMQFLEQLKGKKLSAKPLRSVMNLQESTEQSSVRQQRTSATQQKNQQSPSDDSQSNPDNQPIDSAQHHQINLKSPDSTDYDDEVKPEEELIHTIKSHDSEEKKVEKIKKLFKNELKPNIDFQNTENGDTPLHIAVRKKELQVIELLRRNKAKIDIKNNRGRTSLDIAQSLKRQDIVQVLKTGYIDSNVQALIKDRRKSIDNRELLIAAVKDDKEKVERLIEEEVNVDFVDKEGNTALHYAVSVGNFSIVQLLLNKVKNANIVNNKGETPLDIAKLLNRRDIIQILEEQQLPVRVELSVQQQSQQKRTRADSERNRSEDSNTKKLRTSSSDHQHMEASQDSMRKRIHSQGDRESSIVLEAESNVATSSNHQNVEFGNISSKKRVRFQSNQEDIGALNIRQSTSFLDKPNKYAASGVKNSLHGCIYQLKLLMLFLKRGLDKGYSFRLATEMDAAEKFDDLVFEYKREGGGSAYRFLQAKHKQDEKSIEVRDLLTEDQDGEFRLAKYFVSYRKIKKKPEFNGKNDEIQDFIICTNAGLSNDLQDSFEQIAAQDDLLDVSSESKYPKRLKLKIEKFPNKRELIAELKDASDINRLAKRLIECAIGNKDIGLKDGLFKEYHAALASEVINVKDKKFKTGFIDNDNLSEKAQKFREVLLAKGNLSQKEFEIKMKDINLKLSSTFGKGFKPDDSPRLTNSREFSEAIVNAIKNANDGTINIRRELSKAGIMKDNINKLAGYVLIEKDDGEKNTYYFSPTFFDDSHKLPGNLEDFKSELKAELKNKNIGFDKEKYKFHIANFQTCKEGQLHTKSDLPDDHATEAEIESFFEKLVFAVNQPNETELGKILEAKIGRDFSEKFNYIGSVSRDAYNKFQIEVLNWMKEKEGRFLSNEEAKGFFMEAEQQISTLSIIEKEVKKANGKIDGVEKIVKSNNKMLKEVHSIVAEKSNEQTQRSIWFDMMDPVQSFTGRMSELKTLHDALEDRQGAISQMVSIAGLGGVGKSELARKYAYSYRKDYDNNVIWVDARAQETLKRSFQELAKNKLRIPTIDANGEEKDIEDIIIDAYNYFKSVKSLFIFDDAKSYEDIKKFLPSNLSPDNRKPYVLITSCSQKWETEEGMRIQVEILNDLSLPEAMKFIKETLGIDNRLQDNEVKKLAEVLQCFPLALQEAVWCIRSGESFSIQDYIKEYEKEDKKTELLNPKEYRNDRHTRTVFATLKVTLKSIKQNGNHGKKALEILNVMAYLAPNNLPLEIFFLTLTEDQKELTQKAIKLLCQYSMIKVNDVVSRIHGLVQEVIKLELKEKKGEEEVFKQTFKLLERIFSDNTRNIYIVDHLLVEHLMIFYSHIYYWSKDHVNKKSIEKSYLKDLLIWRAKLYGQLGDFEQKKKLLNEALSIDPEDAIARAELGVAYESLGDYKKQKEYLEQALGIFKKNHDQNDLQVAVVEAKLGKAYGNLKQYEEQKKYLEQSLDVFKKNHNRNDLQIATVKVELGKAYGNLGEYRKQKKYLEQALGVFEKHYPNIPSELLNYFIFWKYPTFLGVHYCLNYKLLEGYNLFSCLQVIDVKVELSKACENLGDYEKQRRYLEQVLDSLKKFPIHDDFRVAIMKAGLGRAYGNLGEYSKQREYLEQASDVFDKRHAEEIDPLQVAITKLNLGRAYRHLNNHDKQKKYLKQALDICRNHDIDDVRVAITKAELGKACKDYWEREYYLKQALDVFDEYYDYDDREAINELKKKLYEDKPQLNEQEKLTAYEKQKRRLARTIRTSEENYSKSSSQASSGSVEPDETVKNSLKYNKFQYAIVLRDLAKVLRDSNMKTSKKDRYARYIMLLQEAKAIFREYYGANHFYVATVLIRLSLYNNEINHMLQQMNVYHKNDESKNDLRSALNIFEKHYNDNYFRVNAEKLVKVSYPNSIHQESEVLAGECLPSISRNRKKREVESECLFTWEDVDEFNVEKDEKRDFNKIEIDSKKFVNYIKGLPEEKRSQLIELADKVKVTGKSQGLIYKLTNNKKVMNHLSRIGKISGMTMHGMMAKNVLADFVNGDYQGVAINVGFIAGGQGFAKVAKAASLKGLKLAAEGKFLLGRSLKAASPFLARGTSAFVVYDLINQIKEFKNGTEEALVSVVGDSIYLGVDAAEIGIEVAEAFEILEGVSSVTGPIGAAIGAVVFVGTDIYMAVKRVDKIDQIIHLKGNEKLIEGLRASIGMQPEQYIEELIEKKQVNNRLVNQGLEYLKQHSDIQGYVFPTGELVIDSDQEVSHKLQMDLDNLALLGNTVDHVIWHRTKPDNPNVGKLFCLPTGPIRPEVGGENAYLCHNAIGLFYLADRTGNSTLIALGKGQDRATGFRDSPNIFLVDDGNKELTGGDKDDVFIFVGNKTIGTLDGGDGNNTLNLAGFALDKDYINVNFSLFKHYGLISSSSSRVTIKNMHRIYGRKGKQDIIDCGCDIRYVDGQGGRSNDNPDHIIIPYCYSVEKEIVVKPSTKIDNLDQSRHGIFNYIIPSDKGKANINIGHDYTFLQERKHNFLFNYTIFDLASVDTKNIKDIDYWYAGYGNMIHTIKNVTFSFLSTSLRGESTNEKFDITISGASNSSYRLGNNAEIKVGNNGNLYMLENTNKSVDEIIKEYLVVANRLNKMSFFIQSLLSNEAVVIGNGNHEVIHNNPLHKSHLVGNGGENIYVVDSETDNVPEVIIHDVDEENSIDTIDLRNVVKKAKGNFELQVIKSENDLLLRATVEKHEYFTVRLKDGVERYNKAHVIVENVPMRISVDKNEWCLKPQPLIFEKDKEVIVITDQDVEKGIELITPRKGGNYTFVRINSNDLMITNAFDFSITKNDLCSITLSRFYETPKMATLSIKFADKEVVLKDHQEEISTARDVNVVKKEHKDQVYNDVFNHAKSSPEVMVSDQPKLMHKHRHEHSRKQIRHRRHHRNEQNLSHAVGELGNQANIAVSSSTKKLSSRINDLFGWMKSFTGKLFYSQAALPEEELNTKNSISQLMDVNGTIMLLDVLVRKVMCQKYISTADQSISPLEAQGYALNITKGFEKVVEQAALKSGVSMHRLNIDFVEIQKEVTGKIMSGKFDEISGVLSSYLEKACPSREAGCPGKLSSKKFDKFMVEFNSRLNVVLNRSIQRTLHNGDGRLEVDGAKKQQMNLEPQSYLSNASVQGHSKDKVSTCLSEIGVTKLGGNLNR